MLLWIPLLPFAGFLVNNFGARRLPKRVVGAVASCAMFAAFARVGDGRPRAGRRCRRKSARLLRRSSPGLDRPIFRCRSACGSIRCPRVMILVITGIGFLIHLYSTAYMIEEEPYEYARYFAYLNLFAAFMLLLVLGDNFIVMFVGWEGVGLCSYLLIGFWYQNRFAADAGKKAFIVNRIGDVAFILGVLLAFSQFGSVNFKELNGAIARAAGLRRRLAWCPRSRCCCSSAPPASRRRFRSTSGCRTRWKGPTPVSALIHAATMVTAGVYLIGRNAVLFAHAPEVLTIVAVIGTATALWAGAIGMVQNDIKRVLAYSTVSQLGYMFMAMGVGAYAAGHLPSVHARVLQGAAVPRIGRGDSRAGRRAGPAPHGRTEERASGYLLDVPRSARSPSRACRGSPGSSARTKFSTARSRAATRCCGPSARSRR